MFQATVQGFNYLAPSGNTFGNNLLFPGTTGSFLSTPATTNLITWKATTGYTIEYWVYLTTYFSSINGGPGNHDNAGTNYSSFGVVTGGQIEFYYWAPGQSYFNTATGAVPLSTWTNIAAVFTTTGSSTTGSIYVNGVRQNIQVNKAGSFAATQTVTNGTVSTGTVFGMGSYTGTFTGYWNNLRVSNVNRYSGASYTLATQSFTYDSNTQMILVPNGTVSSSVISFTNSGNTSTTMTNFTSYVTITATRANHT
jgi:hypothetical protein